MKVKYLRLSKEEKKEVKKTYFATNEGKYIKKSLIELIICSSLTIIYSLYYIWDAVSKNGSLLSKIFGIFIFAGGFAFLISARYIFIKKINNYLTKKK